VYLISIGTRKLTKKPVYFINKGKVEIIAIIDYYVYIKTKY